MTLIGAVGAKLPRRARLPRRPKFPVPTAGERQRKQPVRVTGGGLPRGEQVISRIRGRIKAPWQTPPANWPPGSSAGEWSVYWCLTRPLHMREFVDFQWQANFLGGRTLRGGFVPDFVIAANRVAINVDSLRFHAPTTEREAIDAVQTAELAARGITLIHLWENDLITDRSPVPIVRLAVQGIQPPRGPT